MSFRVKCGPTEYCREMEMALNEEIRRLGLETKEAIEIFLYPTSHARSVAQDLGLEIVEVPDTMPDSWFV